MLSSGEQAFVLGGIAHDVRSDGRARLDVRPLTLECALLSQTNGSARLVLDATDVLVGIKAELGTPDRARPDLGRLHVALDQCVPAPPPPSPTR